MPTVTAFVRSTKKTTIPIKVRFRLSDGSEIQLFYTSDLLIAPHYFDAKNQKIKAKVVFDITKRIEFDAKIESIKYDILSVYSEEIKKNTDKSQLNSAWLEDALNKKWNKKSSPSESLFHKTFESFIEKKKVSEGRERHYKSLGRILKRYEIFKRISDNNFKLDLNTLSSDILLDFEEYLRKEHLLINKYPELCKSVSETRPPKARGHNRVVFLFKAFRAFISWALNEGITQNDPFKKYTIGSEIYGRPIYISIAERNMLQELDLSSQPSLERQRDIFVFQCFIGCRVGDLYRLTKNNIVSGAVEYVPKKTSEFKIDTVRVPISHNALKILEKYSGSDTLLPFIAEQNYNEALKEIFRIAGLVRPVSVTNPTTGKQEVKRLCDIASSHMARRTFIGNIYKKVKDPNLVGSLSGHVEGSKAFARYRDIDEEMKIELIDLLE